MTNKILICVLAMTLSLAAGSAMADKVDAPPASENITADKYFVDLHDNTPPPGPDYMFGDWNGARTKIADEQGVTFASSFVFDVLGNVTGGNEQGARFDSSMGWDINFDLEKLAKLVGTQIHISGLWRQGQNLSKACIGNSLVASSIYGHEQFRFYGLWLEQDLFDKHLNIRIGRIAAGDDFASSPLYWTYVSNGIDGNPITIPINSFYSCYPTAVWGARAKVRLPHDIWLMSGAYLSDPAVQDDKYYGLNFNMRFSKGVFLAEEIAWKPNQDPGSKGMPGAYKAGFYYDSAVFRSVFSDVNGASYAITGLAQKKAIGNYGTYFHASQMIYREKGPGSDEGLTALAVAVLNPSNTNQFSAYFMGGLIYEGLIPGRDDDVTAVQFQYAKWGDDWRANRRDSGSPVPSYESVVEFTHKINITKWMYVQPDLQYIINPGGGNNIKDALVIGSRFGFIF
jgi:porin